MRRREPATPSTPPEQEAKRIRLTNRLAALSSVIMAVWAVTVALIARKWGIVTFDALSSLGFLSILLVARAGYPWVARLAFVALGNGVVFAFASQFAGTTGTHYCFLPLSMLPFALFDTRDRVAIAFGTLLPAGCFALLIATDFSLFAPIEVLPPKTWIFWLTVATAFAMAILITWSFRRENERSEEALRHSRARYSRIVEATQEGICVTDARGEVTYVNPALTRILALEPADMLGRTPLEVVAESHRERAVAALGPRAQGAHERIELQLRRKDGGEVIAWVSASPADVDHPEGLARILLVLDVTDTVQKQRLIEEQRSRMLSSAKLSALGEMAAGIAHEINNPLAALRLSAAVLTRSVSSPTADPAHTKLVAGRMDAIIDRIARIIDGLRTFARDEPDEPLTVVSVRQLVGDTLSFCQERFRAHGIALVVPDIPDTLLVRGRPVPLSQVLVNLLNNAFHAVADTAAKQVAIDVVDVDGTVELSVTDSGHGIPSELSDKVFQPFFTTKPTGVGTGLGLSVSKGIVEAHGGSIRFESEPGRTRFTVALPKAR